MHLRSSISVAAILVVLAARPSVAAAEDAKATTWSEVTVHYSIKDGDKFVCKQAKLTEAGVLAKLEAAYRPAKSEGVHCTCDELNWLEIRPKGDGAKVQRVHFCHKTTRIGGPGGLAEISADFHKTLREIVGKAEGKTVYLLCDNGD